MNRTFRTSSATSKATHRCLAMTLPETLLSAVIIALVLASLVMVSNSLRANSELERTEYTLTILEHALMVYHKSYETGLPQSTSQMLLALSTDNATRNLLRNIPMKHDPENPDNLIILDGFGNPIQYIPPSQRGNVYGDFVSAGPDGQFGDIFNKNQEQKVGAIDNLHGSDTITDME
ncbi:type II secretion system protein GspG [Poriferisphaera sp. WC338]|uniref:type II secretion system protein n=1 Tax=Poriferisphaera sp. WC338 TaxID=3425129 RepID=UPI003D816496